MKIGNINTSKKVFIIAEIGNNHEGNFELAKKMIDQAAKARVDAVKFQTYTPFHLSGGDKLRLERLKKFQFNYEQFEKLSKFAKAKGVIFFSTPFDIESANFLNKIQPLFKISSGDNNFYPLINKVASFNKPIILSTGGADLNQIIKINEELKKKLSIKKIKSKIAYLHCVSSYPVPKEQANLASINFLKNYFSNIEIGYSDHTLGIDVAVNSVFAGARIIEKHFTIDKNYSNFRDHHLSADPRDMKMLVKRVRAAELIFGTEEKKIQICEEAINLYGRRSIAAARDLSAGERLSLSDITWIRPGTGLPPGNEKKFIGRKVKHKIEFGEIINKKKLI